MLNLAAAIERASEFDIVHYEATYYPISLAFAKLTPVPLLQTLHHSPNASELDLWARYPSALYVAISQAQARVLSRVTVVGTVLHAVDTDRFTFRESPDDYLLFVGRFTEGKGVLEAIQIARRLDIRLLMAGPDDVYFRETVAPHVDGDRVLYCGEADFDAKVKLYGGARALLYPLQTGEPFGLVMAEAMACGTPVAALDRGAVREVVDDGLTGAVFDDVDQMVSQSDRALGLDRRAVRGQAISRFGIDRMVDEYVTVYRRVIESHSDRHIR
jgi:glycosyltransferase involved in cell wall biosynthesis